MLELLVGIADFIVQIVGVQIWKCWELYFLGKKGDGHFSEYKGRNKFDYSSGQLESARRTQFLALCSP